MKQLPDESRTHRLHTGNGCYGVHILEDTSVEGAESYVVKVTERIQVSASLDYQVGQEIILNQTEGPGWDMHPE
ncbi:MAG: hypothetical protein QF486_04620 [Candidatus Woesearchaeota archaeon]|nr:hypothetical protein [Candidatus Woesearchaeota archaeon]MDP7181785.1 hypothetical protein [Candidatus Woesearchaeota archaeon]MDP7198874.1 hypothetical protein [Candidatus Woesearchaeota archaeon]MDP7467126.1 hypothetical protein [Candidatus Woesearchaeota archaeon]MDP7647539.1 hypothetical protein [Candidatus Woesearchaeota archaeon]